VLHGNAAGNPTWSAIDLTTDVTGTLPVANGGTGVATTTAYGLITGGTTATGAFQNAGTGTSGQVYQSKGAGSLGTWTSPNTLNANPANPTGTTNTAGVMMGLNQSITPSGSGVFMVIISGDLINSNKNDGAYAEITYGTGTAPSNGAALTGTKVGSTLHLSAAGATNGSNPFSCSAIVSGLTVGTKYWFDLHLASTTGTGTASAANLTVSIYELK